MAADTLAPSVASASAAKILTMQNKQVIVFLKEGFQAPAPSQCQEMTYF